MIRHTTLLSLLLLLGACDKDGTADSNEPAERSASSDEHGHGRGRGWLNKLDADKDGAVSREEAKDHPRLAERFDEIDADKDGKLTEAELRAAKGRHGEGHHGKDPAERAARMMAKLDANGDGALVPAEVEGKPHLAERFADADGDKDGKVTQGELAAFFTAMHERGGKHGGGRGKHGGDHGGDHDDEDV